MQIVIKDDILIINFKGHKDKMNYLLDGISNSYEGIIKNRQGHNFPINLIPDNHKLAKYKNKCKYLIAVINIKFLPHELLHAKYYLDNSYKMNIIEEWNNLNVLHKIHIENFLLKLGYNKENIIDEYQAYKYTENNNFFGINNKKIVK